MNMTTRNRRPAWTASKAEEVISALWLIAGLVAWNAGIYWLAVLCFVKAALDTLCSIGLAIIETVKDGMEYIEKEDKE